MTNPHTEKLGGVCQIIINDSTMEPRIFDGEIAYFDLSRKDYGRGFVVATIMDNVGKVTSYIKRLSKIDSDEIILSQYNPPLDLHFKRENVVSIHPITHIASRVKH